MHLDLHHAHAWDVSPSEAITIQKELAPLVRQESLDAPVRTVAGIDMSVRGDRVQAAVVVMDRSGLDIVDQATWRGDVQFPYVPGLLSFRELPAVLQALEKLQVHPDLLMTDSQGLAHPRRLGLASHLGVLLDMPAIGVAKSRLTGRARAELDSKKGAWVPLFDNGETVGALVRTRTDVKPVYVSVGHRITLQQSVDLTLACTIRYKLPEPTRQAHLLSRA